MRIGIDIQDVERVKSLVAQKDMMNRLFTEYERDYCYKKNWAVETVTGLYCAKEAFFKALGTGVILSQLQDIEIRHEQHGAPYFKLSSRMVNEHHLSTSKIHLSISHTKASAVAVCIIVHFDALV